MDDYEDPPMSELLRRYGRTVRAEGGPRRAAPDLEALRERLDRIDAEHPPRRPWWRPVAALAACLVIGLSVWAFLGGGELALPGLRGTAPELLDTALSPQRELLRGEPAERFPAGSPVWVHYYAERPGWAIVALLQPPATARALTPRPVELAQDGEPLGPFALQGDPGPAALLVITSEVEPDPQQVERMLGAAAAALRGSAEGGEGERREAVLSAFRGARGMSALCLPLVLDPR